MRIQALLALAAALAFLAPATAFPEVLPSRYSPLIVVPGKVCGTGAPPIALGSVAGVGFSTDFDAGVPGYVLSTSSTNYWHVTGFAGQGVDVGHSGAKRLYYGVERPQGGSFNFGRTYGAITFTQPIAIPKTGETFITWLEKWEVEWGGFGLYDVMAVQLVTSPTASFVTGFPIPAQTICISDPVDPQTQGMDPGTGIPSCSPNIGSPCGHPPLWGPRYAAVPDKYEGQTLYLRFQFDAMDSLYNDFLGWMLDDVNVLTPGA